LNEQSKGAKTATVVVPEDQLSLAIGRDGQNARLAAKLTSWRIDIKSLPEAASDALYKLQNDPLYAVLTQNETDVMPQVEFILGKKAEGRPVTPEEYQVLTQFVDRVERGLIRQRQADKLAEEERLQIAQAEVPAGAFEIPLEDFEVSDRVYAVISEAGYQSVGDLMLQMRLNPDAILKLSGMGPKAMKELETALEKYSQPAPEEAMPETEFAPVEGVTEVEAAEEIEPTAEAESPVTEAGMEVAPVIEAEELTEVVPEMIEPVAELSTAIEPEMQVVEATESAPPAEGEIQLEEEPSSLDELFALRPDVLEFVSGDDFEDEDESEGKKKKKKKKKFVEMEYDPDKDVMVVKKKRKRGGADWDDNWNL
jgi:N utilization substance protein A